MSRPSRLAALATALALILAAARSGSATADEWPFYGRDPAGTRYSPLSQINAGNVAHLQPVWTFHTGDIAADSQHSVRSGFETTPLVVEGRLYLTTPFNRVIALDPTTGHLVWAYDPKIDRAADYGDGLINRGLAAWRDSERSATQRCSLRLFEATLDARLIALDGASGTPCSDFGRDGQVSLRAVSRYHAGWYHISSPPIVVDGVVVVGSGINDNIRADMPDGVVRGYDARSGRLLWSWEPVARPNTVAPSAWKTGAANAWSILTADPQHHLVFVPTGSASPDYYGGLRPGDDRWADSVVALDATTGKLVWGFQLVHHDLWDYDTAAAPLLTSLELNGRATSILVAGNKTGMLYVLDPATGKAVLPIEERAVPPSGVPGEIASPTQPFPVTLPPLAQQSLAPDAAWGMTDTDRSSCEVKLRALSGTSIFSPPSLRSSLAIPGNVGGINWSGFAWDAGHHHLIVAVSNLAFEVHLLTRRQSATTALGDLRAEIGSQIGTPYVLARAFLSAASGLPCTPPPWGELVAVDLAAGKIAWRTPLGRMTELFPALGQRLTGSVTLGGPIVTAGGLVFIGGTLDRRFRAFSAETGRELWSASLPASAHAQPITYQIDGKQYVVIAAGGSAKINEEAQSDALIAFALR